MAKKTAAKNFGSLLSEIVQPTAATPTSAAPAPAEAKKVPAKYTSFALDGDLKVMLDRVVYRRGLNSSQREVLNEVLRNYLLNEPTAQEPIPGEQAA